MTVTQSALQGTDKPYAQRPITIAVDCMGGDAGLAATIPGCREFLVMQPKAHLLLVGLPEAKSACADLLQTGRCTWIEATEVIAMDDAIEVALRRKKQSSMRLAINAVKDGAADVAVSSGNTGALMAVARYVLKTMDGVDRPAIATQLPNAKGQATTVLDLGANVDCTAAHLFQFAVMGSALVSATSTRHEPTVGLLNVGEEAIKGSETIKETGLLLRAAAADGHLNFFGNVEGNDIFKGTVDIVVCDGFVGNVTLKASEGLATMIGGFIRAEFSRNIFTKLAAILAFPVLKAFKSRVDHRRYNGAALLGLRGLVFKSHGSADAYGFGCALNRAYDAAQHQLIEGVRIRIEKALAGQAAADSEAAETA